MPLSLKPTKTYTFTVTKTPKREVERKTIQRLMQMQPKIQKGLKVLQKLRHVRDNVTYIRAGVPWTNRARATRLTRVEPNATFTLKVSPQVIPDLQSVEKYLEAKAGQSSS